jgi:hypothetical protein
MPWKLLEGDGAVNPERVGACAPCTKKAAGELWSSTSIRGVSPSTMSSETVRHVSLFALAEQMLRAALS